MIIGVPKEIKKHEYRVGLSPSHAAIYIANNHQVYIQHNAGLGSGYEDADYIKIGAKILNTIEEIYQIAEMIIKVKEPLEDEYELMRKGQIIYTYFHLAASKSLTSKVLEKEIIAIAYETIENDKKELPCLIPMSEIAGRLSVQEGAKYLEKPFGGAGLLLGGVPGVLPAHVVVIGGAGCVGSNACAMAIGLHAKVTAVDVNIDGLKHLDELYHGQIQTLYSSPENIKEILKTADLVISCVLLKGDAAPKLIKREYLKDMKKGSVIVDVAIDQGGSCDVSKLTYHDSPTFVCDDVILYCVGNMPGAVPKTATLALNNSTISYGLKIANLGYKKALLDDEGLLKGLNAYFGKITYQSIAHHFKMYYYDPKILLK